MSATPANAATTSSSVSSPKSVAFSAHGGYSCAPVSSAEFCPGEEFAKLAVIPVRGGVTITRITFVYTVGGPILNAENFPPGPQSQVAQPCSTAPTINLGSALNPVFSLNLKSGGSANYPPGSNPAMNDSGPIAVHLSAATDVFYGYGNPLDTVNPPNYGCWYGEQNGDVQGTLTVQYTTP